MPGRPSGAAKKQDERKGGRAARTAGPGHLVSGIRHATPRSTAGSNRRREPNILSISSEASKIKRMAEEWPAGRRLRRYLECGA